MAEEDALEAVGPVPPEVAFEADATPADERTAEVARICAVLEAADRGPQPAGAAGEGLRWIMALTAATQLWRAVQRSMPIVAVLKAPAYPGTSAVATACGCIRASSQPVTLL